MKKIKKLNELTLNNDDMSKIMGALGGCEYDHCNVSSIDYSNKPPTQPKPDIPPIHCSCGCSGCTYVDGGAGFNLGMNFTNTDGYDCTWYSIF